jgi:hypothetical protein
VGSDVFGDFMNILFPTTTTDTIDKIRDAIGRPVVFSYIDHYNNCSASGCYLNPVTNESTNPFCAVCSGYYFIPVISGYTVNAVITWSPMDIMNWSTAGKYYDGDCLIQVKYTTTLLAVLDKTTTVEVDGKTMEIDKRFPRGVKEINRMLLGLREKEKD